MCGILLLAATLWWSLFHPVDLDVAYMRRIAEKAKQYGDVAGFEICGDCHSPYGGINGLSMLEPFIAQRKAIGSRIGRRSSSVRSASGRGS